MLVAENLESDFYFTSGHRPAIARSHFDSHLTALDTLATHMGPSHSPSIRSFAWPPELQSQADACILLCFGSP